MQGLFLASELARGEFPPESEAEELAEGPEGAFFVVDVELLEQVAVEVLFFLGRMVIFAKCLAHGPPATHSNRYEEVSCSQLKLQSEESKARRASQLVSPPSLVFGHFLGEGTTRTYTHTFCCVFQEDPFVDHS